MMSWKVKKNPNQGGVAGRGGEGESGPIPAFFLKKNYFKCKVKEIKAQVTWFSGLIRFDLILCSLVAQRISRKMDFEILKEILIVIDNLCVVQGMQVCQRNSNTLALQLLGGIKMKKTHAEIENMMFSFFVAEFGTLLKCKRSQEKDLIFLHFLRC